MGVAGSDQPQQHFFDTCTTANCKVQIREHEQRMIILTMVVLDLLAGVVEVID
jgi:hypothetical protein